MKRQKVNLTDQEYRARLLRLKRLGIPIGSPRDPSPEPDRLSLEPIQADFARLYELPAGAVAVVVPARIIVRTAVLITDLQMTTGLDDWPLEDLSDPTQWESYTNVIAELPYSLSTILNYELNRERPLGPCRMKGVILANGWSVVPPQCHDEMQVRVELLLRDERLNEICFEFGVHSDRSLKRKYERDQERRRQGVLVSGGGGRLYEPALGTLGCRNSVSREEGIKPRNASANGDAEYRKPN